MWSSSTASRLLMHLVQFDRFIMPFSLEELYLFKCIHLCSPQFLHVSKKSLQQEKNLKLKSSGSTWNANSACFRNVEKVTETQNAFKDELVKGSFVCVLWAEVLDSKNYGKRKWAAPCYCIIINSSKCYLFDELWSASISNDFAESSKNTAFLQVSNMRVEATL